MLEQDSHLRELAKILNRYRCDFEAALTFGHHKPFRCEPVQYLTQRTDAKAVIFLHRVELEASGRRQDAENDIRADAMISAVSHGRRWLRTFSYHQCLNPDGRSATQQTITSYVSFRASDRLSSEISHLIHSFSLTLISSALSSERAPSTDPKPDSSGVIPLET